MKSYEEQIEEIKSNEWHYKSNVDSGEPIHVNTSTREITLPENFNKCVGIEGDYNSSVITFLFDRYVEGHDISQCRSGYIYYKNKDWEEPRKQDFRPYWSIINSMESNPSAGYTEDKNSFWVAWHIPQQMLAEAGEYEISFVIYDDTNTQDWIWQTFALEGLYVAKKSFETENIVPDPPIYPPWAWFNTYAEFFESEPVKLERGYIYELYNAQLRADNCERESPDRAEYLENYAVPGTYTKTQNIYGGWTTMFKDGCIIYVPEEPKDGPVELIVTSLRRDTRTGFDSFGVIHRLKWDLMAQTWRGGGMVISAYNANPYYVRRIRLSYGQTGPEY